MFGERDLDQRDIEAGNRMLLLTNRAFDDRLPIAVEAWERHHRETCGDNDPPRLAQLLPNPEPARPLTSHITHRPGQVPLAPNWVFRIAAWQIMTRLAGTGLHIDGWRPILLRLDTDGNLLGWDDRDLIHNPADTAHAMARIDVTLCTRPGLEELVLCFDAHLSRIANHWAGTKNVWISRRPDAAILRLPVRHRRHDDTETGETTYTTQTQRIRPQNR